MLCPTEVRKEIVRNLEENLQGVGQNTCTSHQIVKDLIFFVSPIQKICVAEDHSNTSSEELGRARMCAGVL